MAPPFAFSVELDDGGEKASRLEATGEDQKRNFDPSADMGATLLLRKRVARNRSGGEIGEVVPAVVFTAMDGDDLTFVGGGFRDGSDVYAQGSTQLNDGHRLGHATRLKAHNGVLAHVRPGGEIPDGQTHAGTGATEAGTDDFGWDRAEESFHVSFLPKEIAFALLLHVGHKRRVPGALGTLLRVYFPGRRRPEA